MELDGIPLHPLVVHAVVVFAPLAGLFALGYLVPAWRRALYWPLLIASVIGLASAVFAVIAGEDLAEGRGLDALPAVGEHEEAGELMRNVMIAFFVVAALTLFKVRGGGDDTKPKDVLGTVLTFILAGLGIAVIVTTFLAGHSGATAVWGS